MPGFEGPLQDDCPFVDEITLDELANDTSVLLRLVLSRILKIKISSIIKGHFAYCETSPGRQRRSDGGDQAQTTRSSKCHRRIAFVDLQALWYSDPVFPCTLQPRRSEYFTTSVLYSTHFVKDLVEFLTVEVISRKLALEAVQAIFDLFVRLGTWTGNDRDPHFRIFGWRPTEHNLRGKTRAEITSDRERETRKPFQER